VGQKSSAAVYSSAPRDRKAAPRIIPERRRTEKQRRCLFQRAARQKSNAAVYSSPPRHPSAPMIHSSVSPDAKKAAPLPEDGLLSCRRLKV
jgi:hypothetical protein